MPRIGMNLWVTAASDQGGRKYMEDVFDVKFDRKTEEDEARFAYFAVFDGHGGPEAANFAKKHLLNEITKNEGFWCEDDDEKVLSAISEGFKATHKLMWNAIGSWPLTKYGYPSTSGCTASVIFIRSSKMYVGHVGDSGVLLGTQDNTGNVKADYLTEDHKPEDKDELARIRSCGGQVLIKAGVHRVVWDRPHKPCKGPMRRSTQIDHIPFLAVSRALGDLWSYNSDNDMYVVSPEPDVQCIRLDPSKHKTLVLASDGVWHILKPQDVVDLVKNVRTNSASDSSSKSPASALVQESLRAWQHRCRLADNVSAIVIEMDPPDLETSEGAEDPGNHVSSRASSTSTVLIGMDNDEDMSFSDDDDEGQIGSSSRVVDVHDDTPRSTSNTPISGHVMPFTPLDRCVAKNQPLDLLRLATSSKKCPKKLKGTAVSRLSSFEANDQDSRDTGVLGSSGYSDLPQRVSKAKPDSDSPESSDGPSSGGEESSSSSGLSVNNNNSASLTVSPCLKSNRKMSLPVFLEDRHSSGHSQHKVNRNRNSSSGASCSKADQPDKHSGASHGISPSQVHGASSGQSKVTSPRSARQVGLNLTNSTASSSSLNRWPLDTPAGWTSIKGADQEQQVTACSAMGSEIAAGVWPESLDLGSSSLADPVPSDTPLSCYGACEYAPENPPCKKCNSSGAPIKKAVKRKAPPPVLPLSKRFRSMGGHRTRSTINRLRAFHSSRSSRKAAST